jgi:hypothetical protein
METKFDPLQQRKTARDFALEVYKGTKFNRSYALTPESTIMLSALAAAMAQHHKAEGRDKDDLYNEKPFRWLINYLSQSGCNILQKRPSDSKSLPKPWLDPITGAPLPPPKGPDERGILQRTDPDLLAWYDAMEKSPYKAVSDHLAQEAYRKALQGIPYGSEEHERNPFRNKDETSKNLLAKRDPELAKFYQAEAVPVEIPLFGKNKNLSIAGRLTKDPYSSAVVTIAEKIYQNWMADDKATAQAQRAAAEDTLRKLEAA